MKTRARLTALLTIGLVAPVLSVLLTGPVLPASGATAATGAARSELARVRPRGILRLSAPVVQPGVRPAASRRAKLGGTLAFRPRRRHRPVILQRRLEGGRWHRFARKREDRRGKVHFQTRAVNRHGKPFSFRGVAPRWRHNPRVVTAGQSAAAWQAVFVDEFNRHGLGASWEDRESASSSRKCSRVGVPGARSVGHGTLKLRVRIDPQRRRRHCRVDGHRFRRYINGQVTTQPLDTGSFTYGTFAARIKFQRKRGQHGSFWLQPLKGSSDEGNPGDSGAEIDIAEFFGQGYQKGGLASFLYNYGIVKHGSPVKIGGMAPRATRMLRHRDRWWKRYHVISLEWTPRYYNFMVDGRTHYRTRRGVSKVPEYLILSLLSSDWELAQAKRHHVRPGGTMKVDWVEVLQK